MHLHILLAISIISMFYAIALIGRPGAVSLILRTLAFLQFIVLWGVMAVDFDDYIYGRVFGYELWVPNWYRHLVQFRLPAIILIGLLLVNRGIFRRAKGLSFISLLICSFLICDWFYLAFTLPYAVFQRTDNIDWKGESHILKLGDLTHFAIVNTIGLIALTLVLYIASRRKSSRIAEREFLNGSEPRQWVPFG